MLVLLIASDIIIQTSYDLELRPCQESEGNQETPITFHLRCDDEIGHAQVETSEGKMKGKILEFHKMNKQ
jgi:hypothetical protein